MPAQEPRPQKTRLNQAVCRRSRAEEASHSSQPKKIGLPLHPMIKRQFDRPSNAKRAIVAHPCRTNTVIREYDHASPVNPGRGFFGIAFGVQYFASNPHDKKRSRTESINVVMKETQRQKIPCSCHEAAAVEDRRLEEARANPEMKTAGP